MIYLDNSATTKVFPSAAEKSLFYMTERFYNPASNYGPSVWLDKEVGAFRREFLPFGFDASEVVFTSGGTESNNMAILGTVRKFRSPCRIITSKVEHPSVYNVFKYIEQHGSGVEVKYADVNAEGCIDPEKLAELLNENTSFVSLMHVNNETGAVNDLGELFRLIRSRSSSAVFHSDGVQAFCKLPFAKLACDLYSISGHKIHAPKGVGVLLMRRGVPTEGGLIGGGQENGLRSGTTNVPSILALQEALRLYREHQEEWIRNMRGCKIRLYENCGSMCDVLLNGPATEEGAPHILNLSFLGVRGEVLMNALAARDVYVSTGSACSSSNKGDNRILSAMGLDKSRRDSAIRFSLSPFTTPEEIDRASEILREEVGKLRKYKRR